MSLTIATEISKIRGMIGGVDTTELPDATIELFYTGEGLEWINERRPKLVVRTFTTVADQQDYDEKPATAYYIGVVWWRKVSSTKFDSTIEYLPDELDVVDEFAGIKIFDNPALLKAFYKKIAEYDDVWSGMGIESSEGKIRLSPPPTFTGDTVYFESAEPRWSVVTSVSPEYVRGLRYYVAHLALQHLAIKRGVVRSGRNFAGGGGENEKRYAQEYLEKAEGQVPIAPVITRV